MLENAILIKDTPVIDLFDGDAAAQDAEAFYLTQLGGFFASLTAFIAAGYIFYYAFAHASFTKAKCEKINAAFAKHIPVSDEREALKHILEKKILKLS